MSTRIHKYTTVNNKQELRDKAIDNINVSVMFFLLVSVFCFILVSPNDDFFYTQVSL